MKTVETVDAGRDDSASEFHDEGDHRNEERIMNNGQYDLHDSDTLPDLASLPPWAYEDGERQLIHESRTLLAACRFGLARVHLAMWATIVHGSHGVNATIRHAAWHGRAYETSPKPVNADGNSVPRNMTGTPSYRDLVERYGIARCSIERAYEHFVDAVLPYTQNGAYGKIVRVLQNRIVRDLGPSHLLAARCNWLEELWLSLCDLNEVLVRRCPKTRAGRDPVRALAFRLMQNGQIATALAVSFRMPSYQTPKKLADEYDAVETVVGCNSLNRIMTLLADSLS